MIQERFEATVFWKNFSYDAKQKLSATGLSSDDASKDFDTLFGSDFTDYATATELECALGMTRGQFFNFCTDPNDPALCHFWFYSALPLQKMITLLTTKKLNASDFAFNSGLPLNL